MKDTYGRGKVKYLTWIDGRQGSGYKIMYLWNWKFDLVLIRYPEGSFIRWHTDPVPAPLKHHRINFTVRQAEGGRFYCKDMPTHLKFKRIVRFRPDIQMHKVSRVTKGERWVISLGWVTK